MLVKAEVWTVVRTDRGNAVLVRPLGSELAVPIFIGNLEAQSILIGLGDVPMPRPLTHDLIIDMLDKLGARIARVDITELHDSTFYAKVVITTGKEELILDARPSDSVSLVVRTRCPVFIDEEVVKSAGISVNVVKEDSLGEVEDKKEEERTTLETRLQKAVESEDYEKAADIRDRLKELDRN